MPIKNPDNKEEGEIEEIEDDEESDGEHEIEDHDEKIDDYPQKLETQNEDEYEENINRIKNLPGVGDATFKKLIKAGFASIESIAFTAPSVIQEWSGLGEKTVEKLIKSSLEILNIKTKSAKAIWRDRSKMHKLSSNAQEFDELLNRIKN